MPNYSRRDLLKTGLAAGALAAVGALPLRAADRASVAATDWVGLGKSPVKVTRLAFGTGSYSGAIQRELGQAQFTKLVRYAYDRGIRFYETAESYGDMHRMLGVADLYEPCLGVGPEIARVIGARRQRDQTIALRRPRDRRNVRRNADRRQLARLRIQ